MPCRQLQCVSTQTVSYNKVRGERGIKFDDRDSIVAELRGRNGWIRELQDGDAHRMRRLGDVRLIHHEAKWKCEICEAEFDNERCLRGHTSGKWCRKREDMTDEAATNAQDVSSSTRPGIAQGGTDQRVHV